MNESYPSHRVPQQNPVKQHPLHRVALMHPMSHGRVNGVSIGREYDAPEYHGYFATYP
jgi:hypothetical protein